MAQHKIEVKLDFIPDTSKVSAAFTNMAKEAMRNDPSRDPTQMNYNNLIRQQRVSGGAGSQMGAGQLHGNESLAAFPIELAKATGELSRFATGLRTLTAMMTNMAKTSAAANASGLVDDTSTIDISGGGKGTGGKSGLSIFTGLKGRMLGAVGALAVGAHAVKIAGDINQIAYDSSRGPAGKAQGMLESVPIAGDLLVKPVRHGVQGIFLGESQNRYRLAQRLLEQEDAQRAIWNPVNADIRGLNFARAEADARVRFAIDPMGMRSNLGAMEAGYGHRYGGQLDENQRRARLAELRLQQESQIHSSTFTNKDRAFNQKMLDDAKRTWDELRAVKSGNDPFARMAHNVLLANAGGEYQKQLEISQDFAKRETASKMALAQRRLEMANSQTEFQRAQLDVAMSRREDTFSGTLGLMVSDPGTRNQFMNWARMAKNGGIGNLPPEARQALLSSGLSRESTEKQLINEAEKDPFISSFIRDMRGGTFSEQTKRVEKDQSDLNVKIQLDLNTLDSEIRKIFSAGSNTYESFIKDIAKITEENMLRKMENSRTSERLN